MNMKYVFATLTTACLLASCGGSGTPGFGAGSNADKETLITQNGKSISTSPTSETTVRISGSNNNITILTKPYALYITGNDNYVSTPAGTRANDSGSGNRIVYRK